MEAAAEDVDEIHVLARVHYGLSAIDGNTYPQLPGITAFSGQTPALAADGRSVFVNTLLASLLPPGSISFLYYADRVMEFPLGVFGIALASASLPTMARQAAQGDHRGLAATLNFSLRLGFYVAVPATVGLVMLRTPITRVLFERGQFTAPDTVATAQALLWYAVAGLRGAWAYRAINTADAMVGYHGRYEWLGKAAARVDDGANVLPARLTAMLLVLAAALCGGDAAGA